MSSALTPIPPTRFPVIRPELLQAMQALEVIATDTIIAQRMAKLVQVWAAHDPPNAAQYDVDALEFDPLKIQAETATFFELLLRDRVNQNTRAVTLRFAVGTDLDAIASRYPYGVPRLDTNNDGVPDEPDAAYRTRVWLSPSIFSLSYTGQGVTESYQFWALSAPMPAGETAIRHAMVTPIRNKGILQISIIAESAFNAGWVVQPSDQNTWVLTTGLQPVPTPAQVSAVYQYITQQYAARKGLTDEIQVLPGKAMNIAINVDISLFPGVDKITAMTAVAQGLVNLIASLRWLGADLTMLALEGSLWQSGVYQVNIKSPTADLIANQQHIVNVTSVTLHYAGIGQ